MAFDTYNAILFKLLSDNRNIKDSNSIMVTAGLATGSPVQKMMLPFQLVERTEELERKDQQVKQAAKANAELATTHAALVTTHGNLVKEHTALKDEHEWYQSENDRLSTENEKVKTESKASADLLKRISEIANGADADDKKVEGIKRVLATAPVPVVGPNVPVNG